MLSCKEVADRASALIDGELSTWQSLQIRLHLAMCAGCSHFIAQVRKTDQLVAMTAMDDTDIAHDADDARYAALFSILREEKQGGR